MKQPDGDFDRRIDPASLFWARLRLPPDVRIRGHRARTRALGLLFETHLPLPLERVHATYLPVSSNEFIACAIVRDALEGLVIDDPASLGPDSLPEHLHVPDAPESIGQPLNLLHGEFRPRHMRAQRRRAVLTVAFAAAAVLALMTLGIERRVWSTHEGTAHALVAIERLAGEHAGEAPLLPPLVRLQAEARRLDGVVRAVPWDQVPTDAAEHLESLLARWTPELHARIDTIRVEDDSVTLAVTTPSPEMIAQVIACLTADAHWSAEQPSMKVGPDGVRASIELRAVGVRHGRAP